MLTGKLLLVTREEATAAIMALGGKVGNSVTTKTDLLIVGSDNAGKATTKLVKAEKLGVERWDEGRFMDTLRASGYKIEK